MTICACITQWFGSIEAFEEYVQTDVTDVLVHQLQWCTFRYAWSCALGMPAFWACLDVASIPYQHGDVNHVVAWLSYGLTCALLVFPCLGSWSKFFTHLFRHRGRSWLHEAGGLEFMNVDPGFLFVNCRLKKWGGGPSKSGLTPHMDTLFNWGFIHAGSRYVKGLPLELVPKRGAKGTP